MGWQSAYLLSPGLCHAVMAVDQVVTTWCDFGQDDWTRQVGCPDGSFVQASTTARNIHQFDKLGGEAVRVCVYKGQQSRDVELKDAVRIQLITGFGAARLKAPIQSEKREIVKWFERRDCHRVIHS